MSTATVESLLRERIGLDPATLGPGALPRALSARMTAIDIRDQLAFAERIERDPVEWEALIAELLVAETWFFRGGRGYFTRIAEWIRDVQLAHDGPIRAASIPCSTGEEPYSLAIALDELGVPRDSVHIVGIDLSDRHLAAARTARYSAFAFREPLPTLRDQWFAPCSADRWELATSIRSRVLFRRGNAAEKHFLEGEPKFDVIVCRNLLIYLTPTARASVWANLDRLLDDDGLLCLSAAEADGRPAGRYYPIEPTEFALFRKVTRTGRNATPPLRSSEMTRRETRQPDSKRTATTAEANEPLSPRALADVGRIAEALVLCERLLAVQPDSADLHSLHGVIRMAAGRASEAAEAFRRALYLAPDHLEALNGSIVLHEQSGECDRAAALRRKLARLEGRGSA